MPSDEPNAPRRYFFGPFSFETRPFRLEAEGEAIDLTPQQAQLLELLLQDAGKIVSRERIRARLWLPDVHVDFDRGINFCVARVRTALGDSTERPRFIETVPRRGYRFVAEVALDEPSAQVPEENPELAGSSGKPTSRAAGSDSSPAVSKSDAKTRGLIFGGSMVALALLVAVVVGLWLTNRQDEPELRNPRTGAPVIPAPDSQAGYLGSCDPALPVEELDSGARAALSAACWQEQNLADNSTAEAIASFEVVLAHHPEFLPVLARLAQLYALQGGYSRAVPMAKRALQRDPNHPVALFVLADAAFRWSFDWPQAERLFQRGLAAAPEDLRLRIGYANLLSATRRHERAVALARETVAMAPHYLDGRFELAEELYLAGRFREAIAECQALVEIEPKAISAELLIAYSSLALDDPATALAAANRGLEAWGWPPAAATSLEGLWQLIFEGQTFKTPFDPGQLSERAFLAFGAGRTDEAGQLMARACRERSGWSLPYYDVDPRFAPLHALPGLESLERCLTGEYDLGALPAETVRSPSNP